MAQEEDLDRAAKERRLKAIMATPDGRAWMWDHLAECGVFRSSYVSNSLDMSFNEGSRNVGLRLLADLHEFAFEEFQQMEREARATKEIEVENELDETE